MRFRSGVAVIGACLSLSLAGCGLQPSAVEEGTSAPTGIASGVTLYFLDDTGALVAQQRETGRLGTIAEAVSLLLTGPGSSGLTTGIAETPVTRTQTTVSPDVLDVRLPIASNETSAVGIDQIVCTALASHVQSGGSAQARVRLNFTDRAEDARSCPVLGG